MVVIKEKNFSALQHGALRTVIQYFGARVLVALIEKYELLCLYRRSKPHFMHLSQ